LLVEYGDPKALAGALAELIDDADLRAAMGRAGRIHVSQKFSTEHESSVLVHHLEPFIAATTSAVPADRAR